MCLCMDNLLLYKRIIIQSLPHYMLFFYTVQTEKKMEKLN